MLGLPVSDRRSATVCTPPLVALKGDGNTKFHVPRRFTSDANNTSRAFVLASTDTSNTELIALSCDYKYYRIDFLHYQNELGLSQLLFKYIRRRQNMYCNI